jgi:hypothetical protein
MGSLSKRARVMPVSFNSGCDRRRNSLLASSFEGIDIRASSADNMDRRSLTYKWTQEDRLTRSRWMRGLAIFYGCISLLLFVVMAGIKPSHVARNGPTYRSVESAVSSREQVMATPAVQESAMKAVRGR